MSSSLAPRLLRRPLAACRPVPRTYLQARKIGWFNWGSKSDTAAPAADSENRRITDLLKQSPKTKGLEAPRRGALSESSIFAEEEPAAVKSTELDLTHLRLIRDPNRANWKWPKKAAAREVRRRGRLTRREQIAQTEKEHTLQSHFFKTSVKKLAPLARQIQSKKIDDAITQMRFSPKKAARDVLAHLYHVRNEAIVRKEMAPEDMYISQAWVGRGRFGKDYSHRARGRIDLLNLPYTCITILVKETATLERIAREKTAKRARKAPRQHLPSRPIYGQRQYYQW